MTRRKRQLSSGDAARLEHMAKLGLQVRSARATVPRCSLTLTFSAAGVLIEQQLDAHVYAFYAQPATAPEPDACGRCERCGETPEQPGHVRCERCKIPNPFRESNR